MSTNITKKTFFKLSLALFFGFSGESLLLAGQGGTPVTRFLDLHNQVAKKNTSAAFNLTTLSATLQASSIVPSKVSFQLNAGTSFTGMNWNSGLYGYSIGHNPWTNSTTVGDDGVSADISSLLQGLTAADWANGITFVLVALNASNEIISDISKTFPATFALYLFDSSGNIIGTPLAIPVAIAHRFTAAATIPASFSSNTLGIGVSNAQPVNNQSLSQNYPVFVTVSTVPSQQPAATSLKTQAGLLATLKAAGMTVSTAASLVSGTVLPSWNVTINGAWTYSCISSGTVPAAGAVDFTKIAAPLTTAQINAGISTIMLAVDATGAIIADITKTAPASWAMYMFDATGAALPNTPVSITPASGSPVGKTTQLATSVFAGSAIGFTVNGAAPINGTYPMMFTLQATQGTVLTQPIYLNAPLQSFYSEAWVGPVLYLWSEFTLQASSLAMINQTVTSGVAAMMNLYVMPNGTTGFYDATFVVSNPANSAILAVETYSSIINASGATVPAGRYPVNKPYPYLDPVTKGTNGFASTANFSYQLVGQNVVGINGVPYALTNMLMFMPAQV